MTPRRWSALAGLAAAALICMGAAPDPADRLPNPAQEARARALFQQLRCVVCQNESIDDSEADLASDLRRAVRNQIAAGRTDDQVRAFLVQRYGEFILLQPPLSPGNAVLWLTPMVLLLLGGIHIWRRSVARPAVDEAALSADEERALKSFAVEDLDMVPPHRGPKSDLGETGPTR
jgi:cytochrome c-type biogenesis protein CcmH